MAYRDVILADNPVAYWRLGEPSGTNANDETANNLDGTYTNTPTLGEPGLIVDADESARFARASLEYVTVPNNALLNPTAAITLEAWVKSSSVSLGNKILEKGSSDNQYRLLFRGTTTEITARFVWSDATNTTLGSGLIPIADTIYHVVATYDGATAYLYVDGTEMVATPIVKTLATSSNALDIARKPGSGTGGDYFDGWVDEVAIYASALTPEQVLAHYYAGIDYTPPEPDPIAVPAAPSFHRRSLDFPPLGFTVDDKPVPLSAYSATTSDRGGFDHLSGRMPSRLLRKFGSIQQGAPVTMWKPDGSVGWQGSIDVDPFDDDGIADIVAVGNRQSVVAASGEILFQDREVGIFTDEASEPFQATPDATINARTQDGELVFEVPAGTAVVNGDQHALVAWFPSSAFPLTKVRRLAYRFGVVGTTTNWTIRIFRATGPAGARTGIRSDLPVNATSIDTGDIAAASREDMIGVELVSSATFTQTTDLRVVLTEVRVNGAPVGTDNYAAGQAAAWVGNLAGCDTEGLGTGLGPGSGQSLVMPLYRYDSVAGTPSVITVAKPFSPYASQLGLFSQGEFVGYSYIEPAVAFSALGILPLHWRSGTYSELLGMLSDLNDWWWGVFEDFGRGPLLKFAPYGPNRRIFQASQAHASLRPAKRFTRVVVSFRMTDGTTRVHAVEDANRFHKGPPVDYPVSLPGIYQNDNTAEAIGRVLLGRVSQTRVVGTIEVRDSSWRAGMTATLADSPEIENVELRVTATDLRPDGMSLAVEAALSDADILGALEKDIVRGRGRPGGQIWGAFTSPQNGWRTIGL